MILLTGDFAFGTNGSGNTARRENRGVDQAFCPKGPCEQGRAGMTDGPYLGKSRSSANGSKAGSPGPAGATCKPDLRGGGGIAGLCCHQGPDSANGQQGHQGTPRARGNLALRPRRRSGWPPRNGGRIRQKKKGGGRPTPAVVRKGFTVRRFPQREGPEEGRDFPGPRGPAGGGSWRGNPGGPGTPGFRQRAPRLGDRGARFRLGGG